MSSKLKSLIEADRCTLYLASESESTLYTFVVDDENNGGRGANEVQAFKPLDQGITSSVYASAEGINVNNVYR